MIGIFNFAMLIVAMEAAENVPWGLTMWARLKVKADVRRPELKLRVPEKISAFDRRFGRSPGQGIDEEEVL